MARRRHWDMQKESKRCDRSRRDRIVNSLVDSIHQRDHEKERQLRVALERIEDQLDRWYEERGKRAEEQIVRWLKADA